MSPSISVQYGPASARVRSTTRIPSSAPPVNLASPTARVPLTRERTHPAVPARGGAFSGSAHAAPHLRAALSTAGAPLHRAAAALRDRPDQEWPGGRRGRRPYEVGTEAKIVAESSLPDGRSYIVTRGERRFAVESLIADAEPYLMGKVRFLDETDGDRATDRAGVAREALGAYLLAVVAVTEDARGERALVNDLRNAPRATSHTASPAASPWTRLSSRRCSSWTPHRRDSTKNAHPQSRDRAAS